ncbi:MAG: hydroxyacid dehydrogenase [Fimbriimonadaceae bacterium]
MKILVTEVEEWEREKFRELEQDHEVEYTTEPLRPHTAEEHPEAEAVATFIYSKLQAETLQKLPKLELIATRSTGFDHIDLEHCRQRGITVSNVPEYGDNTVAEHVFGLLLTISHRLREAMDRTRRGDFSFKGLQGFDLMDKTLGIIGTGNIGRHVSRIANGFGMHVLGYDVKPDEGAAQEYGFKYVDIDKLLAESDVITLHVPASEKTKNLISTKEFRQMKEGAVLINTARGDVLDNQALIGALSEGKLRAAGLDVLPEEPVVREEAELLRSVFQREHNLENLLIDHVLLRLSNVYITPHSAFNTEEAVSRILSTTAENLKKYGEGQPQNVVGGTAS